MPRSMAFVLMAAGLVCLLASVSLRPTRGRAKAAPAPLAESTTASGAPGVVRPAARNARSWPRAVLSRLASAVGLPSRLRVDGYRIRPARAVLEAGRHTLLEVLTPTVTVQAEGERHAFRCATHQEFVRVFTLLEREPGTVAWLRRELRPDDVLYDVGANIGAFTLIGGSRVPAGAVYAFEPHVGNAASLLANVALNDLQGVVRVLSCALSGEVRMSAFDYDELGAGTAFSHLADRPDATGEKGERSCELKLATTIDRLIEEGAIRPADLVKIDVDGGELEVLTGMSAFLTGPDRPRAVQVEVNPAQASALLEFMESRGFHLSDRHFSAGARRRLDAGADPDSMHFNGIFRPAG